MKLTTRAIVNGKYVHRLAWKRANSFHAVPNWARTLKIRKKILSIYIEAQLRNIQSRTKYQVDHIIPLYSTKVCGLHVPENLQIIPKRTNELKSNIFYCHREVNGKKIYLERCSLSEKQVKISKKYNQTKKNPLKLVKKRSKMVKNRQK